MNLTEAKLYANKLYAKLLETAGDIHNRDFRRIPLEFSRKLTKTGGYFQFRGNTSVKLKISETIMMNNDPKTFIDEVVTHEVAHYIVHEVYGRNVQPHGFEWKETMRMLGAQPKRCHSFKTVKSNTFTYNVDGQIIELGVRRHNKIQSGYTSYRLRGGSSILASMWTGYKSKANPVLTTDFATENRMPQRKVKGKTKANIARDLIKSWKSLGITQAQVLGSAERIQEVCWKANLTPTMAKRYMKNLWEQDMYIEVVDDNNRFHTIRVEHITRIMEQRIADPQERWDKTIIFMVDGTSILVNATYEKFRERLILKAQNITQLLASLTGAFFISVGKVENLDPRGLCAEKGCRVEKGLQN